MGTILASVIVIAGLAALFGIGLAFAGKKLSVEKDPTIEKIEEVLPAVNCGACGYPGCSGYAEAIVLEKVDISLCAPGGSEVTDLISKITGGKAVKKTPTVARIKCGSSDILSKHKFYYNGVEDCFAASSVFNGFMECSDSCLGLGSCVRVCKFDAISIDQNGNTKIDQDKCTGCGACVKECPKKLIELVPVSNKVYVACSSNEKGGICNKFCKVSCIGCKKCEKECPEDAIHVEDFLAKIDYSKCTSCGKCVEVCPKKCIINTIIPEVPANVKSK